MSRLFEEKSGTVDFETPKYSWTQTIYDVQIKIPVPEGTRGRDLVCKFEPKRIYFGLKGKPPILDVCIETVA
jgi:hypothetical protein